MEDYGMRRKSLTPAGPGPAEAPALWETLRVTPRGIDRETSEMMHRTHMGVDNDWQSLLLQAVRNALSDGWGGSMIATEVSDILFGTPPARAHAGQCLGVLKKDQVNILVHGHNPVVSEMVCLAPADDPEMIALAKAQGAQGINLAGSAAPATSCSCADGIAMAGNHLMTELILATGAVEMMIVDYQCIMPSLGQVAPCYHTQMISTSDKAKFPVMNHREFHPDNAKEHGLPVVREAIENFVNRKEQVYIPVEPVTAMGGFSVEAIVGALGGTPAR